MAAPTEIYVDPSIAGDSGTGTSGDPYGDLQYALNTMTRDATDGDRINIKAGSDEVLTAALTLATYGTPTEAAPLIFEGYTSAAGDGGIGGISGNGTYSVMSGDVYDYVSFINLHLHNCGSADVISLNNYISVINCEVDNTTANAIDVDNYGIVVNCYIHNCGAEGVFIGGTAGLVMNNYFENGTNDFSRCVTSTGWGLAVINNIFSVDGATDCIIPNGDCVVVLNNSVYASSGTGEAIRMTNGNANSIILNNIVEGFSGTGGDGFVLESACNSLIYGYNAYYNNTTDTTLSGDIQLDLSSNDQSLGSSPFADASNGDFTVDTSVKALGYPTVNYNGLSVRTYLDIGALQAKSHMLIHPGMSGGTNG